MPPCIKSIVVALSFVAVWVVKFFFPHYQDDNVVEEIAETVIEKETGFAVDLTPNSPEENDTIKK